jgi:hypothetical protein
MVLLLTIVHPILLYTGLMTHHRVAESKVFFETRGMNLLSTKVIETALAIIFSEQGQDGLWNQGQVRSYNIPTILLHQMLYKSCLHVDYQLWLLCHA